MVSSRERVLKALAFEETDRVPMDLAGMPSTGISCLAYPGLVRALGLAPRAPRVYDTGQSIERVTADNDRDFRMSAEEALNYGGCRSVITAKINN